MVLRPSTSSLLVAALCAATVSSQVQITSVVTTELTASTSSGAQTVPAGTVLTGSSGPSSQSTCFNSPSGANVQYTLTTEGFTFGASATSFCANEANASGAILATLSSPVPIAGSLQISGTNGSASFSVDVHDDGSVELSPPALATSPTTLGAWPVVLDSTGVRVGIAASASAATGTFTSTAGASVTLAFVPDGILVPEGTPCGPDLDGSYLFNPSFFAPSNDFDFTVTQSPVTPNAFFVLGLQALALPIPPRFCELRTDLIVALPTVVDPQGQASLNIPIPTNFPPLDFRLQYLVAPFEPQWGTEVWQTSQAMHLRL